jgi:hypothetical protein
MADIFECLRDKPFMGFRVKELVVQFIRYRQSAHEFIPGLQRQIDLESTGKLQIKLDSRPLTIPVKFRDGYARTHFKKVYERVYRILDDREKISDALVDVFVDFLSRDEEFVDWEDHHEPMLREIVDRTCAVFNGVRPENFLPSVSDDIPVPNVARNRLHEDVLMAVEQELSRLVASRQAGLSIVEGPCV